MVVGESFPGTPSPGNVCRARGSARSQDTKDKEGSSCLQGAQVQPEEVGPTLGRRRGVGTDGRRLEWWERVRSGKAEMWRAHGSSEQDRSSGEWSPGHGGSGQQDALEASMETAFPKRQSVGMVGRGNDGHGAQKPTLRPTYFSVPNVLRLSRLKLG